MPGMTSTVFDLVGKYAIEKGAPWALHFTRYAGPAKTPVDLTGAAARLDIFDALASGPPLLTLSTASGEIVLGGAAGTVAIDLSVARGNEITASNLRYRLWFTLGGTDQLYLRGRLGLIEGDV